MQALSFGGNSFRLSRRRGLGGCARLSTFACLFVHRLPELTQGLLAPDISPQNVSFVTNSKDWH